MREEMKNIGKLMTEVERLLAARGIRPEAHQYELILSDLLEGRSVYDAARDVISLIREENELSGEVQS